MIWDFLFGPEWVVTLRYDVIPTPIGRSQTVRARTEFDAKWKVANKLHTEGDPQVGYLAFKWINGLQLDENESVEARRLTQ